MDPASPPPPAPTDLPALSSTASTTLQHEKPPLAQETDDVGEQVEYPEGGLEAWSVVFGSFLAMVAAFGIMNTIGTLQAHLATVSLPDVSAGTIGWIFGLYSFLSFFAGVQIGPIFDTYGPRWLVFSGSICLVIGEFLFSVSKSYWQYMVTFGILCGLGTSLIFTPAVASIGHWFLKRRGYATGVATTGGSIGGILFPLIIQAATPKIGFGWAVRIVAFISLAFLVVANFLIKSRREIHELPSSSASSISEQGDCSASAKARRKKLHAAKIDLTVFKDTRFTLTTLGVFMIEWGIFVPVTYITSYSINLGLASAFSYQILAILNVGSVFGRWLPGLVADKMGRFNTMIITVSFCCLTVLVFWIPSAYVDTLVGRKAMVTVYALLYGFGSGTGISLTPVAISQLCSTQDYGKRFATCYFFVSFGTLTGIPIAGAILEAGSTYVGLMCFVAGTYIAAFGFFSAAKYYGTQGKWLAKW